MVVWLSHKMPPVGAAMTPFPYFVEESDSVDVIESLMERHGIRHIPVLRDGCVVGIVSTRATHVVVPDPYVVEMSAPLDEVVARMSKRRIGSVVVVKRGKLAGILSVTDVCRVLAEILRERYPGPGGNAAA